MNFTFESLKTSRKSVINMRRLYLEHLTSKNNKMSEKSEVSKVESDSKEIENIIEECINEFEDAVLDNLNMAKAISYVWKLAKYDKKDTKIAEAMIKLDKIMGIDLENSEKYLEEIKDKEEELNNSDKNYVEAQKLLEERKFAKESKEYDKADILRDKIFNLGFVVIDEKQGSRIERKEN
jgi:cysteine--tRNA ligase